MKNRSTKSIILSVMLLLLIVSVFSACNEDAPKGYSVIFYCDGVLFHSVATEGEAEIQIPIYPIKKGYSFDGWYFDEGFWLHELKVDSFSNKKIYGDVNVYAKWKENTNTAYKVQYYLQNVEDDSFTLDETKTEFRQGTTDATVSVRAKNIEHFTFTETGSVLSGKVNADDSLVLKLYYTRNLYTVTFDGNGGTLISGEAIQQVKYQGSAVAPRFETPGYYFVQYDVAFVSVASDLKVTAQWNANGMTAYKVQYYLQNVADDGFTLDETRTERKQGMTDTTAVVTAKAIEHFTFTETGSVLSGNINADNSLVLKLYYTRNKYTVTFDGNGGLLSSGEMRQFVKYQGSANAPSYDRLGYTFARFNIDYDNVTSNLRVTAQWTANTNTAYKVEYYLQNVEDDEFSRDSTKTEDKQGTTDTTTSITAKNIEHFTFTENGSILSGNINADGSLVLKLYYTRNYYTVTFSGNGGTLVSGNVIQSVKYQGAAVAPSFERQGYTFAQFSSNIYAVSGNMSASAQWTANTDTAYMVQYYLQNYENDEFTQDYTKTEFKHGTTDTIATVTAKTIEHFSFTENGSVVSGNVNADESLVLKLYYTRKYYTVTFDGNGGTLVSGEVSQTVRYQSAAVAPKYQKAGFVFACFDVATDCVSGELNAVAQWERLHRVDESGNPAVLGSYIMFGSYPQTLVSDEAIEDSLTAAAEHTDYWTSYGYYYNEYVSDFMRYTDVTLGGERYRGVFFSRYRQNNNVSGVENSNQELNGYFINTIYWFKYEPIKWKIVEEGDGVATMVADLILDSQIYCYRRVGTDNYYAWCSIRSWLNADFYNTAFSTLQQAIIELTTVDNSAESTGHSENQYASPDTDDKVFLMSYDELNTWFASSGDKKRCGTDYAKCQNLLVSPRTAFIVNSNYLLRSPSSGQSFSALYVTYTTGVVISDAIVYLSYNGVLPAVTIRLA